MMYLLENHKRHNLKKPVNTRPLNKLGGWKKTQKSTTRRRLALSSRPKCWNMRKRILSTGKALLTLSNNSKDLTIKRNALSDARHFFNRLKK